MAREAPRRPRLDQPLERSRVTRPTIDPEAAGKISERVARYLGSWRFIGQMTVFIVAWILWNLFAPATAQFDPWERGLVLLTLLLSLQASYAAPLILLAQNRQSDRDRVQYLEDRARTDMLVADADYLTREIAALRVALGEVATRDFIRSELRELLDEVEAGRTGVEGPSSKRRRDSKRDKHGRAKTKEARQTPEIAAEESTSIPEAESAVALAQPTEPIEPTEPVKKKTNGDKASAELNGDTGQAEANGDKAIPAASDN